MEKLLFASATEVDAPFVAEILTDATQHKLKHGDMVWGNEGWNEQEVLDYMAESDIYLIRQSEEVVGTVSLQWDDERNWGEQPPIAGYLHRLAVKDGFHGQDLGAKIIEWAAGQVRERGRLFLRLDCEESNTMLCNYYEGLGFNKVGSRPVPEYENYIAALYERAVS